jgi:hypothetical protein
MHLALTIHDWIAGFAIAGGVLLVVGMAVCLQALRMYEGAD